MVHKKPSRVSGVNSAEISKFIFRFTLWNTSRPIRSDWFAQHNTTQERFSICMYMYIYQCPGLDSNPQHVVFKMFQDYLTIAIGNKLFIVCQCRFHRGVYFSSRLLSIYLVGC